MRGPRELFASEDNWQTAMGASFPGERVVVRGKDLFTEFKDKPWQQLLIYMITGRIYASDHLKILEQIWTLTSNYPDPRIWNNRVAAFAGTTKSTACLGVGAAVAVTEAEIYGAKPLYQAVVFIKHALDEVNKGADLKTIVTNYLKEHRAIAGYGRPVVRADERIKPIECLLDKYDVRSGKHVSLAYEVEKILQEGRWRLKMNIAALLSAVVADLGFSPEEFYLWFVNGFSAGMLSCYIDGSTHKEGTLFPFRCNRVSYEGCGMRKWD